tara:strand:- start:775 stop:1443 length:669 start_codon:yes stop_codon:yes gene_type:complete
MNKKLKNPVGRPKTLDRSILIDIALNEYWLYGINNVSLSKIAKLAKVSRPGIYKEFGDEDGLKYEVIVKYTDLLTSEVIPQYYKANHVKTIFYHIYSTLGYSVDKKYFKGISKSNKIKKPIKAKGCLFEKSKLEKHKLNNKSKSAIESFEKIRKKAFANFIERLQKTNQLDSSLKFDDIYDYFIAQLSLAQSLDMNGLKKENIKIIIDTAFSAIINPKYTLH